MLCLRLVTTHSQSVSSICLVSQTATHAWGAPTSGFIVIVPGLGDEDDRFVPTEVVFKIPTALADVTCGPDATAVVTQDRVLLACGNNNGNKLALNTVGTFLSGVRRASMLTAGVEQGLSEGTFGIVDCDTQPSSTFWL